MAAFNWVQFRGRCPVCGPDRDIRCQTHVASDFDGLAGRRFNDRTYHLGERMAWWPPTDPRFPEWRVNGRRDDPSADPTTDFECCYSECGHCRTELYAVVKFVDVTPTEVLDVGREADWPADFWK
jgi:hypothetical protein